MKLLWILARIPSQSLHWCITRPLHRDMSVFSQFSHIHSQKVNSYLQAPCLSCASLLMPVRWFGQPVAQTHPHLISSGEVTPNITKEEYKNRRTMLVSLAKNTCKGLNSSETHILIFPSASKVYMTNDIPYSFRQNSDFLYLCGFQEADSVLVIHSTGSIPSETNHHSALFVPKKDPHKELWEGARSGKTGALELTGVDSAYDYNELELFLNRFCKDHNKFILWYDFVNPVQDFLHRGIMSEMIGQQCHRAVENSRRLVHSLRVKKSLAEIELMKNTVQIASEAFIEVMRYSRPKVHESHLWAKMDFECRVRGAQHLAYPPVVAGGTRANTIHYIANNQVVADGDLVLMDAGCELHGYTSDVTRTWPVNGKFSPAQRKLYEAVLAVQTTCIALCTTNNSLDDIYRQMLALLGIQLQALNIVPQDASITDVVNKARTLCPHHVGHYLGMDVHDTSDVSRSIKLEPGMIVTVEPGIYVQREDTSVPERYRGLGIRIEDDILITRGAPVNLSQSCPKAVEDIERIMS